jgi:Lar family restriction alleviation protein
MDKPIPCPFCNEAEYLVVRMNETHWFYVVCVHCQAEGPIDLGESGAIERWNTRPTEDAQSEAIKLLNMEDVKAKMDRIIELTQELKGEK